MSNKIEWLAVLRGLNILLVVMLHIQLINMTTGESFKFCNDVTFIFNPIRMPLFIFISGGLLYVSRITKSVNTKDLYYDKFQRIMIPFIFFVNIYYVLKIVFNQFTKTSVAFSFQNYLSSFIYFSDHPSAPLWFLATLMIFMLLYPLYCYLCKHYLLMFLFLCFTIAFSFVDFDVQSPYNIFSVLDVNRYLVFFFFGIFFFRFRMYELIDNYYFLFILFIGYIFCFTISFRLLSSFIGILLMCSISIKIAKYIPQLFSSYRDYIFQIYLMALPFQAFIELILWKRLFYNERYFFLFYLLSILVGLYIPVFIAKAVEHCPIKVIRLCFGLK